MKSFKDVMIKEKYHFLEFLDECYIVNDKCEKCGCPLSVSPRNNKLKYYHMDFVSFGFPHWDSPCLCPECNDNFLICDKNFAIELKDNNLIVYTIHGDNLNHKRAFSTTFFERKWNSFDQITKKSKHYLKGVNVKKLCQSYKKLENFCIGI
jgi:hypothetical protein